MTYRMNQTRLMFRRNETSTSTARISVVSHAWTLHIISMIITPSVLFVCMDQNYYKRIVTSRFRQELGANKMMLMIKLIVVVMVAMMMSSGDSLCIFFFFSVYMGAPNAQGKYNNHHHNQHHDRHH